MKAFQQLTRRRRILLLVALALGVASCAGFVMMFFGDAHGSYDTGSAVVPAGCAAAGIALSLWFNIVPLFLPGTTRDQVSVMYTPILLAVGLGVVVAVVGELILFVAFSVDNLHPGRTAANPLTVGLLFGGIAAVTGVLAGWLVLWPLFTILSRLVGKDHRASPYLIITSVVCLTMIGAAISAAIGVHLPSDVQGRGAGAVMFVDAYLQYGGSVGRQICLWIARVLETALIVEIVLIVRYFRRNRKRAAG